MCAYCAYCTILVAIALIYAGLNYVMRLTSLDRPLNTKRGKAKKISVIVYTITLPFQHNLTKK